MLRLSFLHLGIHVCDTLKSEEQIHALTESACATPVVETALKECLRILRGWKSCIMEGGNTDAL